MLVPRSPQPAGQALDAAEQHLLAEQRLRNVELTRHGQSRIEGQVQAADGPIAGLVDGDLQGIFADAGPRAICSM